MKTKAEIILETVEWYKSHPRAVVGVGECVYLTEEGNKCAVGRVMRLSDEELGELQGPVYKLTRGTDFIKSSGEEIKFDDGMLQEEYRGHEEEFWKDLQKLHDDDENWIEGGEDFVNQLTVQGEREMYRMATYARNSKYRLG